MKMEDMIGRIYRVADVNSASLLMQDVSAGEFGDHQNMVTITAETSSEDFARLKIRELVPKEVK